MTRINIRSAAARYHGAMFDPHTYPAWLALHLATVAISLSLFLFRLVQDQRKVDWRIRWPWLRWLPHANDTVLLNAGVALCLVTGWRPWLHLWLGAKIALLVGYVLLGKQALSPGRGLGEKRVFGALALAAVVSMVALAIGRPG